MRIAKEVRTVAPLWILACFLPLVVLAFGGQAGPDYEEGLNLVMFGFYACFAALLGANTFGVEFSYHTVPLLLSQPISRRRIWLEKMVILAGALALSAIAVLWSTESILAFLEVGTVDQRTLLEKVMTQPIPARLIFSLLIVAAAVNAFCLAPWLSLIARNALAGGVFAIALPVVGWISATALFGAEPWIMFLLGQGLCWGVAAVLGYRKFANLEAVDLPSGEFPLPRWLLRRFAPRALSELCRTRWWLQLLAKELRLQQTSLMLSAMFLAGSVLLAILEGSGGQNVQRYMGPWYFVYSVALPLLVGALTCAEERQLATLEWHLALPVRARTQWMIKGLLALAVGILLGGVLPSLLLQLPKFELIDKDLEWHNLIGISAILTVCGVYASSLCRSTVRAFGLGLVLPFAFTGVSWSAVGSPMFALILALVLWLAYFNFRRTDRRWTQLAGHALIVGMFLLVLHVLSNR